MHSIVNRDKKNIVFPSSNLLSPDLNSYHTKKMTIMRHGRGTNATTAIRAQQINVSNQHAVHLNIHNVICHIYFK